jgi:hypothetical protein
VPSFLKLVQESLAKLGYIKETEAAENRILRKTDLRSATFIVVARLCWRISSG